ncbi:MAG: ATP-binding protein [Actinobacteria bacterium]|nr:ATP-binding protein [Actinomycetota bacterium]
MNNNSTQITVFYGDQPAHAHERRAINVARHELARRNMLATLLVNFTVARGARQIDLMIVTDQRCMNVELKHVDSTLPLVATPNGPWRQRLPDGTERMVADHSYYDQALQETYGIADVMADLNRRGVVPGPTGRGFARHIDTVVCCDPRIPEGSTLNRRAYVTVLGLDTLIDHLAQPGPGLPQWDRRHWDELIRHLGLYPEGEDTPAALRRRADAAAVEDYRRRFREFTAASLAPLVPAGALIDSVAATVDADAMADQLVGRQHRVQLTAESGQGKTHLARHTALALTDRGQMVVWVDADDYRKGQLIQSLRRAVSPFSTHEAHALLAKAAEGGSGITVVIDALEKCPHPDKLLEQLHSLQNQYPAAILATTTSGSAPLLAATCMVELREPTGLERARIATTYGTSDRVAESEEYRSRYEITLAAQVIADLPEGQDSNTEVLDAYIGRRTPSETVRAGLRCLAQAMNVDVRTALPITEVMTALRRCQALATTPSAIDDTLASPLVRVHQGRLRFGHEKLARFLAAQHLVLTAQDGAELARLLTQPAHRDLRDHAIVLESDPDRRYDTIRELADPTLIAAAAHGSFGIPTAKQARADITELLIQTTAAAPDSTFTAKDPQAGSLDGTWHHRRQWTPIEEALLLAAGRCAYHGMFLPEIGALMDATDTVMRIAMRDLQSAGSRVAVSTVVACTFGPRGQRCTPAAGVVAHGAESARIFGDRAATDAATATPMWRPNARCFGRLYLAALLSHPIRHDIDAQNLPDLVETGLAVGGYHLRLKLLEAALYGSSVLTAQTRERMIDVLCSYDNDPRDLGTSSTLIDALASYGQITPVTSLEAIQREIATVLSDIDSPDHQALAQGIVASMFEDERVIGPYSEAVDSLPADQRLTLYAMSVMPADYSFGTPWSVKQLAEGATTADDLVGHALARYAGPPPRDTFSPSEAVAAHLNGLSGWAKFSATLPPAGEPADDVAIAWRLVDELLLHLFRGDTTVQRAEAIWERLTHETPGAAVSILCELYRANSELLSSDQKSTIHPHRALLDAYPDQIRGLLQWALTHRDELPGGRQEWDPMGGTSTYAVRVLGLVGTATTADLLRHHYVHDPDLGRAAVEAVHAIDARLHR